MKITNIVFSPTGGTKKDVDALLQGTGINTSAYVNLFSKHFGKTPVSVDSEDLVFIGMPSYGGRAPETAMRRLSLINGNGAKCVLVVVYGNREYEDTLVEMYDGAKKSGFVPIAAVTAVAEHSIDRSMAKGRPDQMDEKTLIQFGEKILHVYENDSALKFVPGNRPYKDGPAGSNCPIPNEKCVKCGKCREFCPVNAIGEYLKGDQKKCISCMGCIAVCRLGARSLDHEYIERIHGYLKSACSNRKEPELYI